MAYRKNRRFLKIKRFFAKENIHPYDEVKWVKRTAEIPGSGFKLENIEFPDFYSQNAVNIIASKYFKVNRGKQETSLKELIDRVVRTFKKWGLEQGYFDEENAKIYEDELTYILLHQYAAFNSPVWFNVGVEGRKQQCSACFILDVEDDMESILDWIKTEGMIFKGGSGAGVNLSKLRAKGEPLSTGGTSSGVISFMKAADAVAGSIRSGGTTRRAAKMVILNVNHPEIMDFIRVKADEENKVRALMEAGYDMTDINNPLWQNIFFQNANNSIRVTDEFMKAVLEDREWTTYFRTTKKPAKTYKASEILWEAAKAAWECGDPGIQFHDTINRWHTCKNSGEIVATNPCSEYNFLNWTSCFAPETRIATKQGLLPISELYERQQRGEVIYVKTELLSDLCNHKQLAYRPAYIIETGFKPVYKVKLSTGQQIRLTADHLVLTSKGWKQVKDLKINVDDIKIQTESEEIDFSSVSEEDIKFYQMLGWLIGDGYISEENAGLVFGPQDKEAAQKLQPIFNSFVKSFSFTSRDVNISCQTKTSVFQIGIKSKPAIDELINKLGMKPAKATQKRIPRCVLTAPKPLQIAFLGGLFSADGSCGKFINKKGTISYYVSLASSSYELLREVQLLLLDLGIRSYIGWTKFKTVKRNPQGHLNLYGYQAYKFLNLIGFPLAKYKEEKLKEFINKPYHHNVNKNRRARVISIEADGIEKVYDVYEPITHTLIAEGLIVHNCNLASINLMKFLKDDGDFDIEAFKQSVKIIFLSQDILISKADYPHPKIAEETKKYRTIGLGYTNLGALIMALGLPYDSNEARFLAASLTSLMTAEAYKTSTEISEILESFPEYEKNKEPMLEVIKMHRDESYKIGRTELTNSDLKLADEILKEANKTWDEVIERGEKFGFRNAQASLLAPTGTISFMLDCDTTGIEPDFALVKMKQLVGGGWMKIVNNTVPLALKKLGYSEKEIKDIIKHLEETQNIESAPHLKEEHLQIFETSVPAPGGKRFISLDGHLKMVAAVQPFLSGAISKTFNMPNSATIEDVYNAFIQAWKLGIKCFAIYRDGSKATQALFTQKKREEKKFERRRLPDIRQSETHKFSIAGHEGYLTYSMFENGSLGEIFIRMSKQGSTLAGLLDAFAIAVSIALQYGVPLKELANKFIHMRFEPMGITNNKEIPLASSIIDYIFKYLSLRFLSSDELKILGLEVTDSKILKTYPQLFENLQPNLKSKENENDKKELVGPPCKYCGGMTVRTGSCYTCSECGESTGGCG